MIHQNLLRISIVLGAISVFLSFVHSMTFEELQKWHDIVEEETVGILPEGFEEIISNIKAPKPNVDKGNRASIQKYKSAECPILPNFPKEFPIVLENFKNWSEDLQVTDIWVVKVKTPKDVATLANWAYVYGYKLRAKGFGQSWAPVTVTKNSRCANTIMVDTTHYLTTMKMVASKTNQDLRAVYVQTGATMENLLSFLRSHKAALYTAPVSGESIFSILYYSVYF